jgi:hypothetical protein
MGYVAQRVYATYDLPRELTILILSVRLQPHQSVAHGSGLYELSTDNHSGSLGRHVE